MLQLIQMHVPKWASTQDCSTSVQIWYYKT